MSAKSTGNRARLAADTAHVGPRRETPHVQQSWSPLGRGCGLALALGLWAVAGVGWKPPGAAAPEAPRLF